METGVRLKGVRKGKHSVAFNLDQLHAMHESFEAKRIEKAKALVGNKKMKPDNLCRFLIERTGFCPHKLMDVGTSYWLETVSLLDGEMGLTLPEKMDKIPALFFEALSVVRNARAKARAEEKKE